jgi:cell pole-organizing protein PopZ
MNKPAPKEPSMDEILSSIRQIIADDDAAVTPKKPAGLGSAPLVSPAPPIRPALAPRPIEPEPEPEPEPLALSAEQIVTEVEEEDEPSRPLSFDEILGGSRSAETESFAGEAELVDPEDVAFAPDAEPEPDPMAMFSVEMDDEPEPVPPPAPAPVAAAPRPTYVPPPMPRPAPRPQPSVAQTAPMPDPNLSSDMAEQLLNETTQSAVKSTFSRLNGLSMAGSGVTLEHVMREMLRPMLKEWLDENLPSVVERMVEKEIARISRGSVE